MWRQAWTSSEGLHNDCETVTQKKNNVEKVKERNEP